MNEWVCRLSLLTMMYLEAENFKLLKKKGNARDICRSIDNNGRKD
jgi:hypothetical protein